jgi:hypothetical protein
MDITDDELDDLLEEESALDIPDDSPAVAQTDVGSLTYDNGHISPLLVPSNAGPVYQLGGQLQATRGLHIPSHRPLYSYQHVPTIPTVVKSLIVAHGEYVNNVRQRYMGQTHPTWPTPSRLLKETLLGYALFSEGTRYVAQDPYAKEALIKFQDMLRKILPRTLGFRRLLVRMPEIILLTKSGEISLDAVSGGVASLIDIAWQIFSFADSGPSFVVTFDEPENHLHPELQRSVLPNLVAAFPEVQFIVSTHNPFVIGSVPDSHVYALRYDKNNSVYAELLETPNRSGTANEILREVLGLESTSPQWVETGLNEIMTKLADRPIDNDTRELLRSELSKLGLLHQLPAILAELISNKRE